MSIDEKAFSKLCENGRKESGLTEHGEFVWRNVVEAYEAAKVTDQADESPLLEALKKSTQIMQNAEHLIGSLNLHDEWHEQGKPHGAFHDLLFQIIHNEEAIAAAKAPKRESGERVMGEGSRLRMENSPECLSGTPAKLIREALEAAPVYVTKDGTWLNFRPDADRQKGGALIKVEGYESEAIRTFGEKVEAALAALTRIEGES